MFEFHEIDDGNLLNSYLVSALNDIRFVFTIYASLDVLRLSTESCLDHASDLAQVSAKGHQVVGVGVERNLRVVHAPLGQSCRGLVGKQAVRVAGECYYLDFLALLVVDQTVWCSRLVG
jgi:hypothetical protein